MNEELNTEDSTTASIQFYFLEDGWTKIVNNTKLALIISFCEKKGKGMEIHIAAESELITEKINRYKLGLYNFWLRAP